MAQKKITDLTLRSDFDATCNVPVDDSSQTWRVTGAMIKAFAALMTKSEIMVSSGNGYGSSNTRVRRWTTTSLSVGSGITYADSATLGGSFTINEAGVYAITAIDGDTGTFGVTVNGSALSTNVSTLTYAQGGRGRVVASGGCNSWTKCLTLAVNDVLRLQTNNDCSNSAFDNSSFHITKVSS